VVAGQEDLVTALTTLRQDARFRMIGNMPVGPLLKLVGINLPDGLEPSDVAATEPPVEPDEEPEPDAEPEPEPRPQVQEVDELEEDEAASV
jgi:hypothetical protein